MKITFSIDNLQRQALQRLRLIVIDLQIASLQADRRVRDKIVLTHDLAFDSQAHSDRPLLCI
jgi:hypothetical protein